MLRNGLFGVLIAGIAALVVSQVVFAHTRPIHFDPAPGAILSAAPSQVTGWFTNELRRDPNWTFLRVEDAQGNRVDAGETQLSSDRREISVGLRPGLAAGRYTVRYHAWDDTDGHISGDCYTFYIGEAAAREGYSAKTRLDGGGDCARLDIAARDATPTAAQLTPTAGGHAGEEAGGEGETAETDHDSDSGGIPAWTLALTGLGGIGLGLIGGRALRRST